MNPFIQESDVNLHCITGKKTSDHFKDYLLSCYDIGLKWQDEFTTGCFEDSLRFEKPIKRRKIETFSSDAARTKVTVDGSINKTDKSKLMHKLEDMGTNSLPDNVDVTC